MGAPSTVPPGQPDLRNFSIEHIFSRFPLPLQVGSGTQNNYNLVRSASGIRSTSPAYVTGTGAHDIIALNPRSASEVSVVVEAYSAPTYAPGPLISETTYNVPSANGILVDAGANNDRLIVDTKIPTFVNVRGMSGTDQLVVVGDGATIGTYIPDAFTTVVPDGNTSFGGMISTVGADIAFTEFEQAGSIVVTNFADFTFRTGNGADVINDDNPAPGLTRLQGASGGVGFVPLTYFNVGTFRIDAASGDDSITLGAARASLLTTLRVAAGAGDDTLTLGLDPADAGFSFIDLNGGTGVDQLVVIAAGLGQLITYNPTSGAARVGSTPLFVTGVDSFTLEAVGTTTRLVVNGRDGVADVITQEVGETDQRGTITVQGLLPITYRGLGAGSILFLNGLTGSDTFNITPLVNAQINIDAGAGTDTLKINGESLEYRFGGDLGSGFFPVPEGDIGSREVRFANSRGSVPAPETLELSNGVFTVSGSIPSDVTVAVNNGATLHAFHPPRFLFGPLMVNAEGTMSPGTPSPGPNVAVLETGDTIFTSGSILRLELNGLHETQHDLLRINGTINLGGANLDATLMSYTPQIGDVLVIVRNDGTDAVTGTFSGLDEGERLDISGRPFRISYRGGDGNDVVLTAVGPAQTISGFTLIDRGMMVELVDGAVLSLGTRLVNILANTTPVTIGVERVSSMHFALERNFALVFAGTDRVAPFALFAGDGDTLEAGEYIVTATPFTGTHGSEGGVLTISFTVV